MLRYPVNSKKRGVTDMNIDTASRGSVSSQQSKMAVEVATQKLDNIKTKTEGSTNMQLINSVPQPQQMGAIGGNLNVMA